jgi:hypothetical protein
MTEQALDTGQGVVAYLKHGKRNTIINDAPSARPAGLIIVRNEVTSMTDTATIQSLFFECAKQLTKRTVQPQLRLRFSV